MQTLKDQRAVVTGGSRGLGLGIVEALVARQAHVTVVARDAARLVELQRRLGVAIAAGDVADRTSPRACWATSGPPSWSSMPASPRRWDRSIP